VYSDVDAEAPHVRAADHAVRIGPPPAADSYLDVGAIIGAARMSGADALHPGYGFLSERALLAEACMDAGIVFVGPSAATLAGLGDKLSARRAVSEAGVPVVPGTLTPIAVAGPEAAGRAAARAEEVGWPLLVKAAAGGGGRGMRRVDRAGDLQAALLAASAEAATAFGDGSVYLERYMDRARHVEVQLLGDQAGAIVALGERDCSVQRRHQKLVEEAPAPGLTPGQRREVHALAIQAARTFGLSNAATAEFLLGPDGRFWFLEVNTRLQVEHGVTELVSGIDLVQEQLWIAAGRQLGERVLEAADAAPAPASHAIEVRVSAEDPAVGFLPVTGVITAWREPGGPGIRVDSGVEAGTRVTAEYDPLLAKLLVIAPDRPSSLARLRRAVDEFHVGGVQTTLPFHRWIAGDREFGAGRVWTGFVDDRWHPGPIREMAARRAARLAAAATTIPARAPMAAGDGNVAPGSHRPGPDHAGGTIGAEQPRAAGWATAGRRAAVERWPR